MALTRDGRRRWLGAICLAMAGGMLIAGMTVLEGRLQREAFVYYWLTCTAFTGLTLIIALLDMRAVRRRSEQERRDLVMQTLAEITREKARRGEKSGEGD